MGVGAMLFGGGADANDIALIDAEEGRSITYGELLDTVGEVGQKISQVCGPRALIACELSRAIDDVIWYLAVASGHVALVVDSEAPSERKEQLYARFRPQLRPPRPYSRTVPTATVAGRLQQVGDAATASHPDLAILLSTSGSTASPKLVRLSRDAVTSNAAAIATTLGLGPGERALGNLSMAAAYGLSVLHSHLAAGATVVLTKRSITERALWDAVAAYRCSSMAGVPTTYRALLGLRLLDRLGPIRTLTQAGGRMDRATAEALRAHTRSSGRQLVVMYGQTEATARITIMPPSELEGRPTSVGIPIQGTVKIVDEYQNKDSATGEIAYEGRNVMMGYAQKAEDLLAPDELGSRLLTGDVGRLDDQGFLYIVGRKNRIAKVDGLRFNLDEIETAISHLGPFYIVDRDGALVLNHDRDEIDLVLVGKRLGTLFKLPKRTWTVRRLDDIPLTGDGKVDYSQLARDLAG